MIKSKIKLTVCLLVALLSSSPGYARQLTFEEAIKTIPEGITNYGTRSASSPVYTEKLGNINVAYIVNNPDNGGYIVVSADDIMPAVLGFSDKGDFDPANIPVAMQDWLKQYGRQLEYAISTGNTSPSSAYKDSWTPIAPLCKSKWDQMKPYNDNCPTVGGAKAPTGCTATAIAQVIYKHKWPLKGTGTNTYTPANFSAPLTFDFGATTFDWENMKDNYSSYNDKEAEAVATLMAACGNASLMQYGKEESGAYPYDAIYGMVNFMGYDKSAILAERDFYPSAVWTEMIYNELANGRPLVYGGYNYEGGHTFVVDGYSSDGYFHLNWGWSGMSDGYFLLTALDPSEQGVGGSSAGYNYYQSALLNVMPAKEASDFQLVLMLDGIFSVATTSYTDNSMIEFTTGDYGIIKAFTLTDTKCELGIKVTPADGGETVFYPGSTVDFNAYYGNPTPNGYTNFYVPASSLPKTGSYIVTPAYSVNGVVNDIAVRVGRQKSLSMTCSEGKVRFDNIAIERELTASNLKLNTPLYSGKNCSITATITNHGEEYLGPVSIKLLRSNGIAMSNLDPVNIDIPDGESLEVTFSGIFFNGKVAVSPGNYTIMVYDENGSAICKEPFAVTIQKVPSGKPVFTSSYTVTDKYSGKGTAQSPYLIGDDFECDLTVNVSYGLFEDIVAVYATYADNNSPADLGEGSRFYNNYFAGEGDSQTRSFSFDTSLFEPDRTVYLKAYGWTSDWQKESAGWFGEYIYLKRTSNGIDNVEENETQGIIYPNPAVNDITVTAKSAIRTIKIFSMTGSMVGDFHINTGESSAVINVENIRAGHYIVSVITEKGTERHRLIKK